MKMPASDATTHLFVTSLNAADDVRLQVGAPQDQPFVIVEWRGDGRTLRLTPAAAEAFAAMLALYASQVREVTR